MISLLDEIPRLVRPGIISKEEIENVIKTLLLYDESSVTISPGTKYRHYAPKTPVVLLENLDELQLLAAKESKPFIYSAPTCSNLYATFREVDRKGFSKIFIHLDEHILANPALYNRIVKAAGVPTFAKNSL